MKTQNIHDYMSSLPIEGVSKGVDALSVTATGLEGKLSIAAILNDLGDYLQVEPEKKFSFQGATGWQRGSVKFASKIKENTGVLWSVLMVTGEQSEHCLKMALRMGDLKYTRLDACVDVAMSEQVLSLPRKLKDGYKGKFEPKIIESVTGDTFYIGSRESGSYLRIYDKSPEYGESLGKVWRFEVEFKKGRAEPIALYVGANGLTCIPDIVFMTVRAFGLPSPKLGQVIDIRGKRLTTSTTEKKLAWLGRQVRPTVDWLVKLGLQDEVYEQLGLSEMLTIVRGEV